jgi:hypothetical protein
MKKNNNLTISINYNLLSTKKWLYLYTKMSTMSTNGEYEKYIANNHLVWDLWCMQERLGQSVITNEGLNEYLRELSMNSAIHKREYEGNMKLSDGHANLFLKGLKIQMMRMKV